MTTHLRARGSGHGDKPTPSSAGGPLSAQRLLTLLETERTSRADPGIGRRLR